MALRAFYLLPRRPPSPTMRVFGLSDIEQIRKLLPPNEADIAPDDLQSRIDGIAMAAMTLHADLVILQPPRDHREAIEKRLAAHGLMAAYEDYRIDPNGSMMLVGFQLADHIPSGPMLPSIEQKYIEWTDTVLSKVSETELGLLVSPWRTFLQNQLHDIFMDIESTTH